MPAPLPYRLLTGEDDHEFCERVSAALTEGYVLYGSPSITHDGDRTIAAQAVLLPSAGLVTAGLASATSATSAQPTEGATA